MSDQIKYSKKLYSSKVLVIGGTAGIGYGVAEAALEHGAHVIISSSNAKRGKEAETALKASYPSAADRISYITANLGQQTELENNVKALFEAAGRQDHIIFTAGDALPVTTIKDITMEGVVQAGMVRFFAALMVAKYARQYLNPTTSTSITYTTGSVSEKPTSGYTVINAYATGLQGLTRGLALDLKPIRVNLVSPGMIETPLWDSFPQSRRQELLDTATKTLPTGRVGQVHDVVEAYLYCMKDENLTGTMISSNGGILLT